MYIRNCDMCKQVTRRDEMLMQTQPSTYVPVHAALWLEVLLRIGSLLPAWPYVCRMARVVWYLRDTGSARITSPIHPIQRDCVRVPSDLDDLSRHALTQR